MRILATSSATEKAIQEMPGEIAIGKHLFEQGIIVEAYTNPSYTDAYLLMECDSLAEAEVACAIYPLVKAGAITFAFTSLVGLPAVSQSLQEHDLPLPTRWPASA